MRIVLDVVAPRHHENTALDPHDIDLRSVKPRENRSGNDLIDEAERLIFALRGTNVLARQRMLEEAVHVKEDTPVPKVETMLPSSQAANPVEDTVRIAESPICSCHRATGNRGLGRTALAGRPDAGEGCSIISSAGYRRGTWS